MLRYCNSMSGSNASKSQVADTSAAKRCEAQQQQQLLAAELKSRNEATEDKSKVKKISQQSDQDAAKVKLSVGDISQEQPSAMPQVFLSLFSQIHEQLRSASVQQQSWYDTFMSQFTQSILSQSRTAEPSETAASVATNEPSTKDGEGNNNQSVSDTSHASDDSMDKSIDDSTLLIGKARVKIRPVGNNQWSLENVEDIKSLVTTSNSD